MNLFRHRVIGKFSDIAVPHGTMGIFKDNNRDGDKISIRVTGKYIQISTIT